MEITTSSPDKIVTDYEFTFTNGKVRVFTVDGEAGDKVYRKGDTYFVSLVERPSLVDPSVLLPATTAELNWNQIFCVDKTTRPLRLKTPEEQTAWEQLIREISTGQTIQ